VAAPEEKPDRAARNQQLFRQVNESLYLLNDSIGKIARTYALVCECADLDCIEQIELNAAEYAGLRGRPSSCFVVAPEHSIANGDTVLERHRLYVVVEARTLDF
jgi:hypothetical protein